MPSRVGVGGHLDGEETDGMRPLTVQGDSVFEPETGTEGTEGPK